VRARRGVSGVAQRRERQRRNWHGYIDVGGINTVHCRLAEPPKARGAIITLEVLDKEDGKPDEMLAAGMRIVIERDGLASARRPSKSWRS
jgi:hypothetical protein